MTDNTKRERSRTDHRYVAEAITETGVTLTGASKWEPSHWEREPLRREAIIAVRIRFKQADAMNVKVGSIRVHRETRWTETVTTTHIEAKFDSEVAR